MLSEMTNTTFMMLLGGIFILLSVLIGIAARVDRLVSRDGASQLYPLAIGNFIVAAMNLAARIGMPIIDADIINEVIS